MVKRNELANVSLKHLKRLDKLNNNRYFNCTEIKQNKCYLPTQVQKWKGN